MELSPGGDELEQIYKLLDCELITSVQLPNGDAIFVDDEGLFKGHTGCFIVRGHPEPLTGKGLVIGTDRQGNSADAKASLQALTAETAFMHLLARNLVTLRNAATPHAYRILPLERLLQSHQEGADQ